MSFYRGYICCKKSCGFSFEFQECFCILELVSEGRMFLKTCVSHPMSYIRFLASAVLSNLCSMRVLKTGSNIRSPRQNTTAVVLTRSLSPSPPAHSPSAQMSYVRRRRHDLCAGKHNRFSNRSSIGDLTMLWKWEKRAWRREKKGGYWYGKDLSWRGSEKRNAGECVRNGIQSTGKHSLRPGEGKCSSFSFCYTSSLPICFGFWWVSFAPPRQLPPEPSCPPQALLSMSIDCAHVLWSSWFFFFVSCFFLI